MDSKVHAIKAVALSALLVTNLLAWMLPVAFSKTDLLRDRVDIGDLNSESGHNLLSWGPVEPDTHGGSWGGFLEGEKCRITYDVGGGDTDPAAYLTFIPRGKGSLQFIKMRVMDGFHDDSFKVYVKHPKNGKWIEVYSYQADSSEDEYWIIHTINLVRFLKGIPVYNDGFQVKIEATAIPPFIARLAVDWIELHGNGTPVVNQTTHGYIQWDEIWRGTILIVGDIIVEQGAKLTIEPGTVVYIAANQDVENFLDFPFDLQQGICPEDDFVHGVHAGEPYRDEGNHISIIIYGTLHAVGTQDQKITITSDSPTPGIYDWNRLRFEHGILSHCIMEYYRILEAGDTAKISHNTLRHIGECGVAANSLVTVEHNSISYAGHELIDMHHSSPTIRNNNLGPNPDHCGIVIDGGSPTVINNIIEGCAVGIAFLSPPIDATIEENTFLNNDVDIEGP